VLTAREIVFLLGKASWEYDWDMGMHIPCCSGWKVGPTGNVIRCSNGPLNQSQFTDGLCDESPHVHPASITPRVDARSRQC